MIQRRRAALPLLAIAMLWSAAALTATVPEPPPAVCVNNKCANTPTSGSGIKWHPGHYMASGQVTTPGNGSLSAKQGEISMMRSSPATVLGWAGVYTWGDFEPTNAGGYTFADLDTDYKQVTGYTSGTTTSAVYNSPRRMMVSLGTADYWSTNPTHGNFLPAYILSNSTYGPAGADGVHFGYGQIGNYGNAAAWWRTSVQGRLIALFQALATHVLPDGYTVDTSPYIEAIMSDETALAFTGSSDYNATAYLAGLQAVYPAIVAVFPHTNVGLENNYTPGAAQAVTLEDWLPSQRIAASGPDVFGASSCFCVNNSGGVGVTWGQAAYAGFSFTGNNSANPPNGWASSGGTDLRGTVASLFNVQYPDLVTDGFQPSDIFTQGETNLRANYLIWTAVSGASPSSANWLGSASNMSSWQASSSGGVLATIVGSPITQTSCPSNYASAGGCNTN
jgi:hypothetical protein